MQRIFLAEEIREMTSSQLVHGFEEAKELALPSEHKSWTDLFRQELLRRLERLEVEHQ